MINIAQEQPKDLTPKVTSKEVTKDEMREIRKSEQYLRDKDHVMVKGKFIFHELRGGSMVFPYLKYKGDQIENYSMTDGEIYTIPYMVAVHLNTNCWYPTYEYFTDEHGRSSTRVSKKVRRCSFQSLEFDDFDHHDKEIVLVEKI